MTEFVQLPETEAEFVAAVTADDDKVHIITTPLSRIGSTTFAGLVEYWWFHPTKPENDLFDLHSMRWEGELYSVISFPTEHFSNAVAWAAVLGMRLVDGVPTLIGGPPKPDGTPTIKYFPGGILSNGTDNRQMHTLERSQEIETKFTERQLFAREGRLIDKFSEGVMLRPAEARDFVYGIGQFADPAYERLYLEMTYEELIRLQGGTANSHS
jgi:hypothetical protein